MRVFESVEAVDVYVNDAGTVTIRQESFADDDAIVAIPPSLIPVLINALKAAAKEALESE